MTSENDKLTSDKVNNRSTKFTAPKTNEKKIKAKVASVVDKKATANSKPKFKLYIPYHDNFDVLRSDYVECVYIGDKRKYLNDGLVNLDNYDNVWDRNPPLNELVAYYHAWKNDKDSEYIGACHYRRHFVIGEKQIEQSQEDQWGLVPYGVMGDDYLERIGLNEENINYIMKNYDLVLPKTWSVKVIGSENLYDHFAKHSPVGIAHLDLALKIISKINPEMGKHAMKYMQQDEGLFTNLIYAKRSIFMDYCEWYFSFTEEMEAAISADEMTSLQYRNYVSEWIFMIYFSYMVKKNGWRCFITKRTFVQNPMTRIQKIHDSEGELLPITVATVSSDNYSQHTASLIQSIIKRIPANRFLDFIIVGDGWSDATMRLYREMEANNTNLCIRFKVMDGFDDLHIHSHFTKHTFFRFAFPSLFAEYDKVIYLDSDITVNSDISELYDLDIGQNALAAVPCTAMKMMVGDKTLCLAECGSMNAEQYIKDYVGVDIAKGDFYFNAGVLLINIPQMSKNWDKKLKDKIDSKKGVFWFVDQDILNSIFAGKVYKLEERWNVQNLPVKRLASSASVAFMRQHMKNRKSPAIIHYAGGERKPWNDRSMDMASFYWGALKETPWYDELILGNSEMQKLLQENQALKDDVNRLRADLNNVYGEFLVSNNNIHHLRSDLNQVYGELLTGNNASSQLRGDLNQVYSDYLAHKNSIWESIALLHNKFEKSVQVTNVISKNDNGRNSFIAEPNLNNSENDLDAANTSLDSNPKKASFLSKFLGRDKSRDETKTQINTINNSKYFDANFYISFNKLDLVPQNAAAHYLLEGSHKCFITHPEFDQNKYLSEYEDVLESKMNPLLHYELHGKVEGRQIFSISQN
jgi:lipopolysaccharide biosynthesis glycosyltransferase